MFYKKKDMMMGEKTSSAVSTFMYMLIFSSCQQSIKKILGCVGRWCDRLIDYFNQVMEIRFDEYADEYSFKRNQAYTAIEAYLGSLSTEHANRLNGTLFKQSHSLDFCMAEYEDVKDKFKGVKVKWLSASIIPRTKSISWYPASSKKFYSLTFKRKHRKIIVNEYLKHVMQAGQEIIVKRRQRRLYTNNPSDNWSDYKRNLWSHVIFDHPATFETLAIDPKKKEEIISELVAFRNGKEYYAKTGKAWKRGYLLYGPPGTGKSSLIAAMANFLSYDVYDIELTAVKNNTELRKLLTDISSKSIVMIEDIDCSLDLTSKRKKKEKINDEDEESEAKENGDGKSKVTLSGLLNFIDGLWSASGGERIIVFTTNHKEKLDPALIRRGRMDQHIELSYCKFGAFKVLAKNYLDIDSHDLFDKIGQLLEEVNMTPADVIEHLMLKTLGGGVETSLESLIQAMETAKEESKQKANALKTAKEESKKKATEEEEQGNG